MPTYRNVRPFEGIDEQGKTVRLERVDSYVDAPKAAGAASSWNGSHYRLAGGDKLERISAGVYATDEGGRRVTSDAEPPDPEQAASK
ncbi:MAG TPA: hypothetical protein VNC50_03385 [Planctomycetia bacterium]|nr:hypothetical protein [Planctomycetia bacterium]